MTDAQKVQLGQLIEADVASESRERQIALAGTRPSTSATFVAEVALKRTVDDVAEKVGLGSGR